MSPKAGLYYQLMVKLAVIGQGYVGLGLAIQAVESGFTSVVGLETDCDRLASLREGISYVEGVSDQRLADALQSGSYHPSDEISDLVNFDYAVIAVPTPLRDGVPDLEFITVACVTISPYIKREATIILESTTYPGTTEDVIAPLLERLTGLVCGMDFFLGYSPERIDPGNATWSLKSIPKLVSGVNEASLSKATWLYSQIVSSVVKATRPREAELAKILENTFRHVNIALVNEFALIAHDLDIDIWEVTRLAATKPFGFMSFTPGPGVGGHCLPVDPTYFAWHVKASLGRSVEFIDLANSLNRSMPLYVADRTVQIIRDRALEISDARVLLVGMAYKANVGDLREAPSLFILERLRSLGVQCGYIDSHVPIGSIIDARSEMVGIDAVAGYDVTVIIVNHSDVDIQSVADWSQAVLDCCNCVVGTNVKRL